VYKEVLSLDFNTFGCFKRPTRLAAHGIQEVRGSTPLISTKSLEILGFQGFFRAFEPFTAALEFSEISIIQEVQKWRESR